MVVKSVSSSSCAQDEHCRTERAMYGPPRLGDLNAIFLINKRLHGCKRKRMTTSVVFIVRRSDRSENAKFLSISLRSLSMLPSMLKIFASVYDFLGPSHSRVPGMPKSHLS
jgi:hypothetical protein